MNTASLIVFAIIVVCMAAAVRYIVREYSSVLKSGEGGCCGSCSGGCCGGGKSGSCPSIAMPTNSNKKSD